MSSQVPLPPPKEFNVKNAEGALRAALLAIIVALSNTTPAAAEPEGSCPGDYDVGDRECDCSSGTPSNGRVYRCTEEGWEFTGDIQVFDDQEDCEENCQPFTP
jgi:hypothetical protein